MTLRKCQFCGHVGPHLAAHISPRSLYLHDGPLAIVPLGETGYIGRSLTGLYDTELWCASCEVRSNNEYESHVIPYLQEATRFLKPMLSPNGQPLRFPKGDIAAWHFEDVDPLRLHLFALSVIWRASASKRKELAAFTFGPYQERIRKILDDNQALETSNFPYLLRYELDPDMRGGFFLPVRVSMDGVYFIHFVTGGFAFDIKVSNQDLPPRLRAAANFGSNVPQVLSFRAAETRELREAVPKLRDNAERIYRILGSK